jgi:hypothetical protein
VVVLRLRGRTTLGATFIKVVADYAGRLADADGRLYLSGLQPDLIERLRRTGTAGWRRPAQQRRRARDGAATDQERMEARPNTDHGGAYLRPGENKA